MNETKDKNTSTFFFLIRIIPVHQPQASCILHQTWTGDLFLIWYYTCFINTLNHLIVCCSVTKSYFTLHDAMDCSLPSSSVHGISQTRTMDWVAISFYKGSSQPRDSTCVSYVSCIGRWVLYHWCHLGSPKHIRDRKKSVSRICHMQRVSISDYIFIS